MVSRSKKNIGYVVMPAGHGKSYNHLKVPGLVEADMIFNCRGDITISELRRIAKQTGEWDKYDKEWSERLNIRLTDHKWIIMIPAREIGENLGGEYLGYLRLCTSVWEENLRQRGETFNDYMWGTKQIQEYELFISNESLSTRLAEIAARWMGSS